MLTVGDDVIGSVGGATGDFTGADVWPCGVGAGDVDGIVDGFINPLTVGKTEGTRDGEPEGTRDGDSD